MVRITDNIILFMFGGNCTFTIQNQKSCGYYKLFRKHTNDGSKVWQLYLKQSNKNIYCGYFKIANNKLTYKHNTKYGITESDPRIQLILDVIHNRNNLPETVSIFHVGRCAHCGRMLIDPQSMKLGFGPKCWQKVKGFTKKEDTNNDIVEEDI